MSSLSIIQDNLKTELVSARDILPKHVNFDRFITAAAVAMANNSDLMDADRQSLINSLTTCAKDGLIPDNREAAMVVFKTKVNQGGKEIWIKKAQYMPMIDGVMKRARQTGEISIIAAKIVYENDTFRAWMDDLGEHISYEPTLGDRGNILGAFAYARMKQGDVQFEWMNFTDIEKVRMASKNATNGPWKDWWEGMARKSVMHRLARRLPNSSELMEMLERGNEMNWQQDPPEKDITPRNSANTVDSLNDVINGTSETANSAENKTDEAQPTAAIELMSESDRNTFDALIWQMEESQTMNELRGVALKIRNLPKDQKAKEEADKVFQKAREKIEGVASARPTQKETTAAN